MFSVALNGAAATTALAWAHRRRSRHRCGWVGEGLVDGAGGLGRLPQVGAQDETERVRAAGGQLRADLVPGAQPGCRVGASAVVKPCAADVAAGTRLLNDNTGPSAHGLRGHKPLRGPGRRGSGAGGGWSPFAAGAVDVAGPLSCGSCSTPHPDSPDTASTLGVHLRS
jgi:hypothetical protein